MLLLLKTSKSINTAKPLSTCSLQRLESVWKYKPTLGIRFSSVVGAGRKAGMQRWLCCLFLVPPTVWHGLYWISTDFPMPCSTWGLGTAQLDPPRTCPGEELCRALLHSCPCHRGLAGDAPSHRRLKALPKPIQNNPQGVPPKQQSVRIRGGSCFP